MSLNVPLFGDSLREAAKPWLEELGKSDRERLMRLLKLAVAEKTRLSDVLNTLFYGEDTQTALANLTRLRKRLNDAAKGDPTQGGADLGLQFHVDTKKQSPPTERTVWFTGPDEAVMRVTRFSQQVTADVAGRPFIHSKGIATTGGAMEGKKRVVRFFVSYAHENKVLADSLVKALRSQFAPSKSYELELWIDRDIMVGEKWHDRILRAIDDCHFGLFMVSPDFLGSRYIGENEIPPFISAASCKPVIPVGLVPVNFDRDELKGLHENQIFFLNGRTFDQMRQPADKTKFARHLRDEMEKRLDAHFAGPAQSDADTRIRSENEETREVQAGAPASPDLQRFMPPPEETKHFQRTRGLARHLAARESLDPAKASAGEARDALDELEAWAVRAEGSPFFALLGEVGIGKTTTLMQFTRQLIEKRQKEPAKYPLPIYIDLRDYVGDKPETVPTIEELLTSVIQRSWRVTDRSVTAGDLLRLVREEGAMIIFDGLDEKIVHLTQSRARDFIRTLWSVLPQAMLSRSGGNSGSGKMLLSCRSHYFRDVWSQNAMLTGEDREGIDRCQYPAFCLLPFDEGQIRGYLTSFLGDEKHGREAFELIASIHNLRDLAERPYLLSLISGRLGELEALQIRGETVNAARLYDLVVRSWLSRDDGKLHLDAMHKRRLMEALAAALWRSGEKQWDVDRLEEWFDGFLHRNPAIASAYANKDRALLKEDLRTATFVLRPDTEARHFRFAHTSLQEYFLACHLARALADKADAEWDMPMVSLETLDFLGQMLATNTSGVAIVSLERILGGGCLQAALLAFKYWLEAIKRGHPEPEPQQVNLAGADLEEWHIKGLSKEQPLNLRGSNLRGARLNRSRVEFVDFSDADLSEFEARQALFLWVDAKRVQLRETNLLGLQWRHGSLEGTDLSKITTDLTQFIHVKQSPTCKPVMDGVVSAVTDAGHCDTISCCAWNPAGTAFVSGSWDGTLRMWDASSGTQIMQLQDAPSAVRGCAWSADGSKILSGVEDGTMNLWDVVTGRRVLTFKASRRALNEFCWDPKGNKSVLTASDDGLKIWDSTDGRLIRELGGTTKSAGFCSWSPDGKRVLANYGNGPLIIFNLATSEHVECPGLSNTDEVLSCAWNPEGGQVVVGTLEGKLITLDALKGVVLQTIHGEGAAICSVEWRKNDLYPTWLTCDGTTGVIRDCKAEITKSKTKKPWIITGSWNPDRSLLLVGDLAGNLRILRQDNFETYLYIHAFDLNQHPCAYTTTSIASAGTSRDNSEFVGAADSTPIRRTTAAAWTLHALPEQHSAIISGDGKKILHATPEAWRWLGWEERDAKGRFIRRLPAEVFGPIPGMED